jgi:hypothetical protein
VVVRWTLSLGYCLSECEEYIYIPSSMPTRHKALCNIQACWASLSSRRLETVRARDQKQSCEQFPNTLQERKDGIARTSRTLDI